MKNASSGAARMKVLTALLRLRQCCCDARLLGAPVPEGESATEGKLGAFLELLDEALDGGHRVLVFSQFTSMLDLLGSALTERRIDWLRLDGSTRDRAGVVERFQSRHGPPVFLISLKAGGVGLNLTAADTVIHFDPWWNPSVEAQATDRAHRMGQRRVVTSIKLIARDTVEARVLRLQESKRELLRSTLDAETAWGALQEEDLAALLA
jgi:SNF2 family DNA or RNA helicase